MQTKTATMPRAPRRLGHADIMTIDDFAKLRAERRPALIAAKRQRRVEVGPFATFYFENYDTMWWQVHEMLYIERGGEEQIADELAAYNPLIPQGAELVATMMIEIEDPVRRAELLAKLGGIENSITLVVGGETIAAVPEADIERTKADGKTSSVHFVRFPFAPSQIAAFKDPGVPIVLGINHPHYGHMAMIPPAVRAALAKDFD